jgi:hypothetical protein
VQMRGTAGSMASNAPPDDLSPRSAAGSSPAAGQKFSILPGANEGFSLMVMSPQTCRVNVRDGTRGGPP